MTARSKSYFQTRFVPGYVVTAQDLDDLVDSYVDLEAGKVLSDQNYTLAEKQKLAATTNFFYGYHATLAALRLAHPTGIPGGYAVLTKSGQPDTQALWDVDANDWQDTFTEPGGVDQAYVDDAVALLDTQKQDNLTTEQLNNIAAVPNKANLAASVTVLTANYELTSADAGKIFHLNSASALTVTLPETVTTGVSCKFKNINTGVVTFTVPGTIQARGTKLYQHDAVEVYKLTTGYGSIGGLNI